MPLSLITYHYVATVMLATPIWLRLSAEAALEWQLDCLAQSVWIQIGWPLFVAAFLLRVMRIKLLVSINRLRRRLNLIDTEYISSIAATTETGEIVKVNLEENSDVKNPQNYEADEDQMLYEKVRKYMYWAKERRLVLIALGVGAIGWVINSLLNVAYGFKPNDLVDGLCPVGPQRIFSSVIVGAHVFIGLPACYFAMRRSADAYYLTRSIQMILATSLPIYFLYILGALVSKDIFEPFNPSNFAMIGLGIAHTWMIVIPPFVDMKRTRQAQKRTFTYADFVETLADDVQYDKMRDIAVEEFCAENPMFWDAYCSWAVRCLGLLVHHPEASQRDELISKLTAGAIRDGAVLRAEINKSSGLLTKVLAGTLVSDFSLDASMSCSLATALVKIYRRFVADSAPFEINVPITTRQEVAPVLAELEKKLTSFLETGVDTRKGAIPVPGVVLRFGSVKNRLSTEVGLIIPFDLLERMKSAILMMMFQNTYPRFIKKHAKA